MTFKVKAGVVMPPHGVNRYRHPRKYPFDEIGVGEIFFIPDKTASEFATYASKQAKILDRKFQTQTMTMRRDLETDEWEPCKPGSPGSKSGVAVTRVA